jgi:Tol biopolymer transport system component
VPAGGSAPPVTPGPPVAHPPIPPIPAGPGEDVPPRRGGRRLVLVGAVTLAVIAGTTAAVIALNHAKGNKGDTAAQPPASPSAGAPAYPTDTMLIRVDTGAEGWPGGTSVVKLLTPGKAARTLISDKGNDVGPDWSPDRQKITLTRRMADGTTAIWMMDADGSNPEKVIGDVAGGASWSADGTKLAFMREVDGKAQIFILKIGESEPTQLTWSGLVKDDPDWSPDGKKIVYWAEVDGVRQIFVLTIDNPEEPGKQITKGDSAPGNDPAWSPDGKTIAYTHKTSDELSDIWLVGSDGSKARQLTFDADREMDPSWAPGDGGWVAFTRGVLAQPRIVIVKADGTEEETLTQGDAREGHPCWS